MGVGAVGVGWDRGVVGCWSTGTLLAFLATGMLCRLVDVHLLVNHWDTVGLRGCWDTLLAHGQPLANCWPAVGQPMAFVAAGAHSRPVVNHWSTVGQLLVNRWLLWLLGHSAGLWSTRGQLLVNHWSTGTTLAFIAAWVHSWFVVNLWPTVGQPLVNWDSTGTPLRHHWDTPGLCGHQGTL